eukprot:GILK01002784.1.p1 GENE.GILK01002784.1~~GILK01002784.1.p1  ORF type:complete len:619 (-),score=80.15 GILK01002784.1:591-2447(-)
MSWVLRTGEGVPSPRYSHSGTVVNGKFYVFGGTDGPQFMADLFVYDFEQRAWSAPLTLGGNKKPTPRQRHSMVFVPPNKLVMFGGAKGGTFLNDLYVFNTENNGWAKPLTKGKMPSPRFGHAATTTPGRMWVFGGHDGTETLNDMYYLDLEGGKWVQVLSTGTPPPPGPNYSAVTVGSNLLFLGGELQDLHFFDFDKRHWTQRLATGTVPEARTRHAIVQVGGEVFMFGGLASTGVLNDLYCLTPETNLWTRVDVVGECPGPRMGHCMGVHNKRVFLFGGSQRASGGDKPLCFNDFYEFNPDAVMNWNQPATRGTAPRERCGHSCSVIPEKGIAVIFGGDSRATCLSDVNILDYKTMAWVSLPSFKNPPPALVGHTAVNVHTKIFIWGGGDTRECFADLWTVDVGHSAWTWQMLKQKGRVPTPRVGHAACCIGNTMYIVGGYVSREGYTMDVYCLDLRSLTWTAVAAAVPEGETPPDPRLGHAVVAYKDTIYMYGGSANSQALTDMWMLDTRSFLWMPIQAKGVNPGPRFGHTMTLFENKIFLFAGGTALNRDNELFIFEIATKIWTNPKVSGRKPTARSRHTAAAIGDDLLVFGGGPDTKAYILVRSGADFGRNDDS